MSTFKNNAIRLKALLKAVIIALLFLIAVLFNNGITKFVANSESIEKASQSSVDINEAFADDCVVVVLDHKISGINKIHDVKFFTGVEIESITDLTKREINKNDERGDFKQILQLHLKEKSKENVLKAVDRLKKLEGVLIAEPNHILSYVRDASDPGYTNDDLWGLNGTNGINVPNAWNLTKGNNAVRVGVIDSGIANHPDLNANLVAGRDTFHNNDITNDDVVGHGTHVAGTIGAVGNNELGVVGVNWNVSLVPLQVDNDIHEPSDIDIVHAIQWAQDRWGTNEQVPILNCSIGGFGESTLIRAAISEYNGLFVWAAGNAADNVDAYINTYGSFNLDNLISVGAINASGGRCDFSNYSTNNTNVHIYAPGDMIVSTYPSGLYASMSGTSMAAPHVAGVAALMLSANPDMTGGTGATLGARLKHALINNADTISITIPTADGSVSQNVKKLNAFKATSSAAFTTGTASGYGGIRITGFKSSYTMPNNTNLTLPERFAPLGTTTQSDVTAIGENAFINQTQLKGVEVPTTVASIGNNAFSGCTSLKKVDLCSKNIGMDIPDHFTSYTNYYYTERCLNVRLEAGVMYRFSFDFSGLAASVPTDSVFTSLGVGENTFALDLPCHKNYGPNEFSGTQVINFIPTEEQLQTSNKLWCRFIRTGSPQNVSVNIKNVKLHKGVSYISNNAFDNCPVLETQGLSYRLKANNTYAVEGMIGGQAVPGQVLFIPSMHNGIAVTSIDARAFKEKDIVWAFFQSGLNEIGNRAFQFVYNLETVNLSATSVTRFEDYTFDTCKLGFGNFKCPPNLTYIGEGAFIRTGQVETLPNSITTIGDYAFAYSTEARTLTLPSSLISIGAYAFCETDLHFTYDLPATVVTIGARAFKNSEMPSKFSLQANSALTTIGEEAFYHSQIETITIPSTVTYIGANAFAANFKLTVYTECSMGNPPAGWNSSWNGSHRPVVWGCTLSSDKSRVLSFVKTQSNPQYQNAEYGISDPGSKEYNFVGWYTTSDFSGTKYTDLLSVPLGMVYAKWNQKACVAEGTLITLADGSHVAVEDLTGEEELLVWNLLTGQFDSAPILFVDSDPYRTYEITHLFFSDGTEVKVIDEHAFWDIDLNKYVFIRNDAARYIGHWFSKQDEDSLGNMVRTTVQLVDVQVYEEQTTAWSPVTYGHLCFYVNDMLSMPGATEGLINIFDVDATTMTYDAVAFAADVAEYGLFTYEEFAALIPVPEVVFDAFNGQYLKISIGKGLITLAQIAFLIDRYSVFFS